MEPVPGPSLDLRPTARFPSPVEIAGVVAGLVPFMVTVSSMSSRTVNGELVDFVYRDWVAIGFGCTAGLFGLVSALQLGRTEPAKRLHRGAVILVLLGLGALQVLRGVGRIGVDRPETASVTRDTTAGTTAPPMPRPVIPAVDVDTPTRAVFEHWRAGHVEAIYDAAHPDLKTSTSVVELDHLRVLFERGFGKVQTLGDKLDDKYEDETFEVTGKVVYDKATLDFAVEYRLVDGKPLLRHFVLTIPDAFQRKPIVSDADAVARRLLDGLLARRLETDLLDPALEEKLVDFDRSLAEVLAQLGRVKSIDAPTVRACPEDRCLTFQIRCAKQRAELTVDLDYKITSWEVRGFHLHVVDGK